MHEASLCDALLDQVDAAVRPYPDAIVRAIHVAVGALSGVDAELFATAFETLQTTRHPHAHLSLTHVAARWQCPTCGTPHTPDTPLTCPGGHGPLDLAAGGDLTLLRIELDTHPETKEDHV
jgi:Zn finger protein HypA/HybF involved in hydrogenase expression